ncbi:MAG: DegT/DnrJ/EryC1/StrS family aminotransferase [Oscillospiraceae bacterium]|nr:DegT/DnrJ/EryC1/StrS family aminotransferase [Oscillospiraceae bacterium]
MRHKALYDKLQTYSRQNAVPFHMPGHKRRDLHSSGLPWQLDITEIDGFDNLHGPEGVLRDAQARGAALWGSEGTYFLVDGSTGGLLAGIYAAVGRGEKILLARNCHKAVYHGIELLGLCPIYLEPPMVADTGLCGSISPETVEAALHRHPDIRLAVITSPTYEGVCSDIRAIGELLHQRDIPLFVDEAHGAHLGLGTHFPPGAVAQGADLVVQSFHKTLPSLTQTAVLHRQGGRIAPERLQHALGVFQSSSPSYPLLASIDGCIGLLETEGETLLGQWRQRLEAYYERAGGMQYLTLLTPAQDPQHIHAHDPSKLTILTSGASLTGTALMVALRERYNIELEMALDSHAIAMTGLATTDEDLACLHKALTALDKTCTPAPQKQPIPLPPMGPQIIPAGEALRLSGRQMALADSIGEISRTYLWAYPPGIPLITPGMEVTEEIIACIQTLTNRGVAVKSTFPAPVGQIEIVDKSVKIR